MKTVETLELAEFTLVYGNLVGDTVKILIGVKIGVDSFFNDSIAIPNTWHYIK